MSISKKLLVGLLFVSLLSCSIADTTTQGESQAQKGDRSSAFSFTPLRTNAREISLEKVKKHLKAPRDWSVTAVKIDNPEFAKVTGKTLKDLKIIVKKPGKFTASITLRKAGREDYYILKASFEVHPK